MASASKRTAVPQGNASAKRVSAVLFWIIALVLEFLAILSITGDVVLFKSPVLSVILFLVLDLVFCILGSNFWKQGNLIAPVKESDSFRFWLYNNLGMIAAATAFLPFILISLSSRIASTKTKATSVIAAIVYAAIAVITGLIL